MEESNNNPSNNPTKGNLDDLIPVKEQYSQLIAILSNRRRNNDGKLIIGYSEVELKQVLNHETIEETRELLNELNDFLLTIGLSIIFFPFNSKTWVAIKSMYAQPIELREDELAILGSIIMQIEHAKDHVIDLSSIVEYLTSRDYFNEYKVKRIVKYLADTGYIHKTKLGKYAYGPKLLIETNEEARKVIADQTTELLF